MTRIDIASTRLDLLKWAGGNAKAKIAADRLAQHLFAHASPAPPKTRRGLVRALEDLRDALR